MVRPPPPKSKIQPLLPIQIQPSTKSNDAQPNHRPHQHQAAANTMNNSPVPNPMASGPTSQIHTAPPLIATPTTLDAAASASSQPAAPGAEAKSPSPQQRALQQQIQAQLQSQLQAQLQAAAARGKQVNITPEMIQAQAQAMVQAAAQAQAVVAAAKNRGGGLVPMNSAQIVALSQIQAQAIVNARPQTALGVGGKSSGDEKPSPQQIQNQIQLQAQALVHAHTQAQISAGIYKGGDSTATSGEKPIPAAPLDLPPSQAPVVAHNPISNPMLTTNMHVQQPIQPSTSAASQLNLRQHSGAINAPTPMASTSGPPPAPPKPYAATPMQFASSAMPTSVSAGPIVTSSTNVGSSGSGEEGGVIMPATSPEFLAKLDECLTEFWAGQLEEMRVLGTDRVQTENDFKNHNDLPLARIKRIMKSDEDVRMISAEAPVLFAKACEMFILEMTLRSWNYSENNKRKTLQKEDVKEAIQRTDIFDFLVDVIQ